MKWKREKLINVIEKPVSGEWGTGDGEVPVIRTTNFTNTGHLDITNIVCRNIDTKIVDRKRLILGDIIIEKSGGSPTQPVGRVVFFDRNDGPYVCNNFTSVLRPKNTIVPKYLFWSLFAGHQSGRSLQYQNKTTGIINLKLERYTNDFEIPLPPLHIQQQIADTLDKADTLRRKDQELLQKYNELTQSIFYDLFGDPVQNERGWEVRPLKDLSESIQIGPFGSLLHAEDYVSGGVPLVNPSHIRKGRIIPDLDLTVTDSKLGELKNYVMRENDIVMGRRGEMGRCAVITSKEDGWLCGTGSLFIRSNGKIEPKVLGMFLSHSSIRDVLERSSLGTTMSNLNQKIVSNLRLIVPPKIIQKRFTDALQSLSAQMHVVDLNVYQTNLLFQNLLNKNFS